MINSGLVFPPLIAIKAEYWKKYFGKASYTIATIIEALKRNLITNKFEIHIDGKQVNVPDPIE